MDKRITKIYACKKPIPNSKMPIAPIIEKPGIAKSTNLLNR